MAWSEIHENQIATASGDGSIKLWDITLMVGISASSIVAMMPTLYLGRIILFEIGQSMLEKFFA